MIVSIPPSDTRPGASSPSRPVRKGLPAPLASETIDAVVVPALAEDRGPDPAGDITSQALIAAGTRAQARLVAKAAGRLAGIEVFARVFALCDPGARIELACADGDTVAPGAELARIEGEARGLLLAERTALNLIQHMSGIATRTAEIVRLAGPTVRVLDTRKTLPNLRALEKHAVRCGGGENHRFGLFDEAMIKENHLELAGNDAEEAVSRLRAEVGPYVRITAEARDAGEALGAVRAGADVILLDNMSPGDMKSLCSTLREAARERGRSVELEASGGIDETTIRAVAQSGVDRISIGALTHSTTALDLSLYLEPVKAPGCE